MALVKETHPWKVADRASGHIMSSHESMDLAELSAERFPYPAAVFYICPDCGQRTTNRAMHVMFSCQVVAGVAR